MYKFKRITFSVIIFLLSISIAFSSQSVNRASASKKVESVTYAASNLPLKTAVVTANATEVHTARSSSSKIMATLNKGTAVYITDSVSGWYKISYNGIAGWVTQNSVAINVTTIAPGSTTSAANSTSAASGSTSTAGSSITAANTTTSGSTTSGAYTTTKSPTTTSAAVTTTSAPKMPVSALPAKIVVGYYTSWSAYSGYTPDKIKASMLNVVHYAFANISSDYKITVGDATIDYTNFTKLNAVKSSNPNLKTIISIGGWNNSSRFSDLALNDSTRVSFVQSCVSFIKQYGFDGVDIDWEYPVSGGAAGRPEDKTNFTLLMKTLREKLDAQALLDGKYYYLTFAGGASNGYINNVQLSTLAGYVDYAVDMTYDLHGPWDTYADLNAPLYTPAESSPQYKISSDSSLKSWLNAGFPANKLVMGIPFYGYLYDGVSSANNGLYSQFLSAKALGYDSIVSGYVNNSAYAKLYHSAAQVPYLYGNGRFISYDDPASIAKKAQYTAANGLRGVSAWELSYDKTAALLTSAYDNLR